MKNLIGKTALSIFIFTTQFLSLNGQECNLKQITFTTQSEIDSFKINHPKCIEVFGDIVISGSSISNLDSLDEIEKIIGSLTLKNNEAVENFKSLKSLRFISGDITIQFNQNFRDFEGLEKIKSLGGISILDNPSFQSFNGLSELEIIRNSITIHISPKFQGFEELKKLVKIGESLSMTHCPLVSNFMGLAKIKSLEETLFINNNDGLKNFTGLEQLQSIGKYFNVLSNDSISNFDGLNSLEYIGEWFEVRTNINLIDFSGLNNLYYVGLLEINWNPRVKNLNGLEGLELLEKALYIKNCDSLEHLDHLEKMQLTHANIALEENPLLIDINGLKDIDARAINLLSIRECPLLNFCSIRSICNYLSLDGSQYNFTQNQYGCNSSHEILSACTTPVSEVNKLQNQFIEYPNPVSDVLSFKNIGIEDKSLTIRILNISGQIVRSKSIETNNTICEFSINTSNLNPGLYNTMITNRKGETVFSKKIVKK